MKAQEMHSAGFSTLYVDVTYTIMHWPSVTGVSRVERNFSRYVCQNYPGTVIYIAWNKNHRKFFAISYEELMDPAQMHYIKELYERGAKTPAIKLQERAAVLIMGTGWLNNAQYMNDLNALCRDSHAALGFLIHDLIPVLRPHWMNPEELVFADRCLAMVKEAAILFFNSKCSHNDTMAWLETRIHPLPPTGILKLGDDFVDQSRSELGGIFRKIGKRGFVLFVSGFSIRKRHIFAFNLWRKLAKELDPEDVPLLVCVGYRGKRARHICREAEFDPFIKNHVLLLSAIDDSALEWLYSNCLFTIFPSLYEGWGLPVGEAAAHGKICIASDVSSIPEVAPGYTDLIDPMDFNAWYERILSYLKDEELRKAREKEARQYKSSTWEEFALGAIKGINTILPKSAEWEAVDYNIKINDFSSGNSARLTGPGWTLTENNTLAMISDEASILFRIRMHRLPARIELCLKIAPGTELEIQVNGIPLYLLAYTSGNEKAVIFVPPQLEDSDGFSEIRIVLKLKRSENSSALAAPELESLEAFSGENSDAASAMERLRSLNPAIAIQISSLLSRRGDLRHLAAAPTPVSLLLWIWRYGIGEEKLLARIRNDVSQALKELNTKTVAGAYDPAFTELIKGIWEMRPDLQAMDISKPEGEREMLAWYVRHGIAEYNLFNMQR